MVIGDPYRLAFIVERMPKWEPQNDSFRNGIMFLCVDGEVYPKDVRTTTFFSELPDILGEGSALMNVVTDKELYTMPSDKLLAHLESITYPEDIDTDNDYRFIVPFTKINDIGFNVFLLSDGENVRVLVGQSVNRRLSPNGFIVDDGRELAGETQITLHELESIRSQLAQFYDDLNK